MTTTARKRITGRTPRAARGFEYISREEGIRLLDLRAREFLGMSGEEFIRKFEAGEIEDPDRTEVLLVSMLIPFSR